MRMFCVFTSALALLAASPAEAKTLQIRTKDGITLTMKDFASGHPTQNMASGTYYYVTQKNFGDDVLPFAIVYGTDNSISIGLLKKPLGATRHAAELWLLKASGLHKADLCRLNLNVSTPNQIDSNYSGTELGLSFCPGSVALK